MSAEERKRKNAERQRRYVERIGKDAHNERRRERYALNADRERERSRRWTAAHPGKRGKQPDPETNRRNARIQYYKRRGAPLDATAIEYVDVLRGDPCAYCGRPGGTIDHIEPIKHGGDSHFMNLTAACDACNRRKHARRLLPFMLVLNH